MAQGQRLNPAARDAAVRRITLLTTGVVALGLTGTVGLGVAIASGIPVKADTSNNAAYEEEVVVEDAPEEASVPTTEQAPPQPPATGTGAAGKVAPTPTTPTQKKPVTTAPKPRVTTKAPQTQSGGS